MLTYNPFDTTADTAGLGRISNKLGAPGAALANILMQLIGSAAFVLGGLTLFSGVRRLFKPRPPRKFWDRVRRVSIFGGCALLSAGVLSAFPIPQDWPMASGLGGWIGDGIFLNFRGGLEHFNIPVAGLIAAFIIFIACAYLLARFIGIVSKDVLDLWDAAGLVWATFRVGFDKLVAAIRVKFDKTYGADISNTDTLARTEIPAEPKPKKVRIKRRVTAAAPPAPGMKSQRIINLSDDIARNMSAQSTRIAVVPGRNAMGVELPNKRRETVWLRDMLASDAFKNSDAKDASLAHRGYDGFR